jgi:hypothetical protein
MIIHSIDVRYVRRCRNALSTGRKITLAHESPSGPERITGDVRSIEKGRTTADGQQIWDIEVIPSEPDLPHLSAEANTESTS